MEPHLRRAVVEDAAGVAQVYVASWNAGFGHLMAPRVLDAEQVARWALELGAGAVRWWLVETGGTVIGFAGTGPSRDPVAAGLGELDTIAVAPAAWRQGVGGLLMDAALTDLVDAGFAEAILWTVADYARGRDFYEASGWRASGEVRDSARQIAFRRTLLDG